MKAAETGAYIVVSRDLLKGAPGLHSPARFEAGAVVFVEWIHYPGMPLPRDIQTKWQFWTSFDIDCAMIFSEGEVSELRIHQEHFPTWLELLETVRNKLPFSVFMYRTDGAIELKYLATSH